MRLIRKLEAALLLTLAAGAPARAADSTRTLDQVLDAVVFRESQVIQQMRNRHPLVETYVQMLEPDPELGTVPRKDQYFIGKLDVRFGVNTRSLVSAQGFGQKAGKFFGSLFSGMFLPDGFARMFFVDDASFDRASYSFEFVRREFLGEVRTMVFEVKPRNAPKRGRFLGRIWVEDEGFSIVRFNGTFTPSTITNKHTHFDSWRVQMGPNTWLPAYVYTEETDFKVPLKRRMRFKAQTRLWGYDVSGPSAKDEFTKVMVDAPTAKDAADTPDDLAPVGSQRAWERLAENNVIDRMTKSGLMAPEGEVDRVLQTVVTNIEVTNNLDIRPEVRCRVLLTTPFESFTVGHTIVLSRGLIDVLPDEASLAMILSHELAHIALGHQLDTKYAFSDRLLFEDEDAFRRLGFRRNEKEELEANQRALELLANSPYKDKLAGAGLFLEQLQASADALRALISPHLGDRLASGNQVLHMAKVMEGAPTLEPARTDQIAALPIGGRIKVNPWTAKAELLRNKPVALLSAREKMAFEVTPFFPYLTREGERGGQAAGAGGNGEPVADVPASETPQ